MKIVRAIAPCSVDECWRAFTDYTQLTKWVPGLRAAWLVAPGRDGLPREVQFEFAKDFVYSLLYTYDAADHVVRWEPREANHNAVRGFAQFAATDEGTEVTYALEHETGRKAAERAIDDPKLLVEAFVRFLYER